MKPLSKESLTIKLNEGARRVDIREVEAAVVPPLTDTWSPVPHGEFITLIVDKIFDRGLAISDTFHSLSHAGLRYFGMLDIRSRNYTTDHSWVVGIVNSNDKSNPATIIAGCRIFASNALAFSSEISMTRRHTKNMDKELPKLVDSCIRELWQQWNRQDERLECYKRCRVDEMMAHHLILKSFESKIISTRDIQRILHLWRKPKSDRFNSRTAWSLFNCFLISLHELKAQSFIAATIKLTHLFDEKCEFNSIASPFIQPDLL